MNRKNKKSSQMPKTKLKKLLVAFFILFSFQASAQNQDIKGGEVSTVDANDFDSSHFYGSAKLQILNKTTAKNSVIELKLGEKITLGTIKIIAHKCWQASLEQKPESKILLEVFELKNNEKELSKVTEKRIFYGWMFASSPSLSSLEHPIYDITALSCK